MKELSNLMNFELKRLLKSRAIFICLILIIFALPVVMNNLDSEGTANEKWYGTLQLQMIFLLILIPCLVSYVWKGYLQPFENAVILLKLKKRTMYILAKIIAVIIFVSIYILLFYLGYFMYYEREIPISLLSITLFHVFSSILYCVAFSFFISFYLKRTMYLYILSILYLVISIYLNSPYFSIWFNPDFMQKQMSELIFNLKRMIFLCIGMLFMFGNVFLFSRRVNG